MSFNIFTTLSKDNKELTHTAFLKFLLLEDKSFSKKLFGVNVQLNESEIKLEQKLNKKLRADLKIDAPSLKLVLENKFKSLPQEEQLNNYSKVLDGKNFQKFLLYFQSGATFKLPADWRYITYDDVNAAITEYLDCSSSLAVEKKIFLKHYQQFLRNYINSYRLIMSSPEQMMAVFHNNFSYNGNFSADNSYWLKIIFHELASKLGQQFKVFVETGASYKPLINVHIPAWEYRDGDKEYAFVVQLNGTSLKYYAHLKKVTKRQEIIDMEVERLKTNGFQPACSGEFKKKLRKSSSTGFIYRERLADELNSSNFTIEGISSFIIKFIERIEGARAKNGRA